MGQKSKTPKGEISITNSEGRIRLRFRHEGKRYNLSLPFAYSPENLKHAVLKQTELKLDILKGCFDTTLKKYKTAKIEPPKACSKAQSLTTNEKAKTFIYLNELVEKFNDWGKNIRNVDVESSVDYLYIRKLLEKWINIPINQLANKLNNENWAATTYNRRLIYLNSFLSWLLKMNLIESNCLQDVCKKRDKGKKKNSKRIPLSEEEITKFLNAIFNNEFCPLSSSFKHSYYHPFLSFIFYTGVRNAEAIGLRVRHVDLKNKHVEISETFARTIKGTSYAARIQKGTKSNNIRYLPLSTELISILSKQIESKQPNDFVFPSPKGLSIDDKLLQKRILKPVLIKMGLGDKDLYCARHSFGTRAIQQGMPLTDVAYLMGHSNIETASRNYVHITKKATILPSINVKTN
jgi:integrase